jgi:mRNA interferase RelE/StbE
MKRTTFSRHAQKVLGRIPANVRRLIRAKIAQYAEDPGSLANNVTAMKGKGSYLRLRVGDWRVVIREDVDAVHVTDIGPRGGIYD